MLKIIRFVAICVFAIGLMLGFYFLPSGEVNSDTGNSPLYAASLNTTVDNLTGPKDTGRTGDGKGGGEGNFVTCEITCGPTCNQTTCGITCVSTCLFTCASTCSQVTCEATCVATCANTCANTCSQTTCDITCVVTCSYTCDVPISLVSFNAEVAGNQVALHWTTGTEVENYRFVIYRSTSPEGNFAPIAEIPCTGEGASTTSYAYNDAEVSAGGTYYYKLSDVSIYGYETLHQNLTSATIAVDFGLEQNYPNPFNPETVIRFTLPSAAQTQLAIFDMSGRQVRTLVNGMMTSGHHEVTWNASDDAGTILPSGVYLYRLNAGALTAHGKMVFVK